MKLFHFLLIAANAGATAILLAIPIGRMVGMVAEDIDAAAVFGWLVFFVPLLTSALALSGILFSKPVLIRLCIVVAMPGSFLMACVALFTMWNAPTDFKQIGIGVAVLLGLNVLVLWKPFVVHLETLSPAARKADEND